MQPPCVWHKRSRLVYGLNTAALCMAYKQPPCPRVLRARVAENPPGAGQGRHDALNAQGCTSDAERGTRRAWSRSRVVLLRTHFIPASLRDLVALSLERQCDRTLGKCRANPDPDIYGYSFPTDSSYAFSDVRPQVSERAHASRARCLAHG